MQIEKKFLLPNAITATNMLLGFLSITMSMNGKFKESALLIFLAMIFDALDGKTARKLNAFSEFGKEFDSFCDAISFGMAPALLAYSLFTHFGGVPNEFILPLTFLYALCGTLRLVKFNIVTTASDTKDDFVGMPIPNGAGLIISYYLFIDLLGLKFHGGIFSVILLVSSVLMVSTVPFKTPDKAFAFVPKKIVPFVALGTLLGIKLLLFPMTLYYATYSLLSWFYANKNSDERVLFNIFNKEKKNETEDNIEEVTEIKEVKEENVD